VIATDHPALAGHFPGNPIVPGALILDAVLQAVEEYRGRMRLKRVVSAKFTSPLRPGESFSIKLNEAGDSHIDFECSLEGRALASGRLAVEPGGGPP
jgi:3-hydroxymyristoyl/3-hydroxydecanoyl-(acyl carrier protein) dehydratase